VNKNGYILTYATESSAVSYDSSTLISPEASENLSRTVFLMYITESDVAAETLDRDVVGTDAMLAQNLLNKLIPIPDLF
jgi:hypothetical protein